MSATCTRVPVLEGHTESVLAITERPAAVDAARDAFDCFGAEFVRLGLPSAPQRLIVVHDDPFRPQPRLDRTLDDGMATSVGRLRADSAFENGLQYVLLSHNTKMGAAKGTVLTAELLAHRGYIGCSRRPRPAWAPRERLMLTKIHHVGIVVRSLDAAYAFYRDALCLPVHKEAIIQDQGVRAALLTIGESEIELLEPIAPGTGVARFLDQRGEGSASSVLRNGRRSAGSWKSPNGAA